MDVLIFGIILIALTAFVAAPLYRQSPPPPEPSGTDARHDALISALRDLEVDRASGLLSPEQYERERAVLEREAAAAD